MSPNRELWTQSYTTNLEGKGWKNDTLEFVKWLKTDEVKIDFLFYHEETFYQYRAS